MATSPRLIDQEVGSPAVDFDAIHKLPRNWRYFNISVIWIFYYPVVIRLFYRLRIRHEIATLLSIGSGLGAAWLIASATSYRELLFAAFLVHLKDLFDAIDGALARLTATGHRLGRFLDTLGDGLVFTAWIVAIAWRGVASGTSWPEATGWAFVAWFSLFLQCSYFNFHQLHYIRLSGRESTSRLNERASAQLGVGVISGLLTRSLARLYDLGFGWQDRLIAQFDRRERGHVGLPADESDPRTAPWYNARTFMVANSALCFGTHAFMLIVCLLIERPMWFFPAIAVGINLHWLGIVLARQVVFHRAG